MRVKGFCPMGCGETLFLGEGGYVTCSWVECPRPDAASELLDRVEVRAADARMIGLDRTDVVIYTQGIDWDSPSKGTPPKTQLKGRLFINGAEIPAFLSARTLIGPDFMQLVTRLHPSTLEIVPLENLNDLASALPKASSLDRPDRVEVKGDWGG